MAKQKVQSVEPNIADLANGWLKSYKVDYKLEQESLNTEIDNALNEYLSKNGGKGGNRPDAKALLQDKNLKYWPILIEYKGYEDKLLKLNENGQIANRTEKNEPDYKNINSYAVNGAVHYANAILHYTSYEDIIAIGMTGFKNANDELKYSIGVYYVSKNNFGVGQKIDDYTDLSFLKKKNFDEFVEKVKSLHLTNNEVERIKAKRDQEIAASLVKLNNDIYNNEKGLGENDRVYLVAASIIATLGIPNEVAPLEKSELKSSLEEGERDGDVILRKIIAFLKKKQLPDDKRDLIVRTLQNTLTTDNINKPKDGESQLKRVFSKIVDNLGIYYKIGLTTDFTGKLFNEMYSWLGFTQDRLNDVVLTPSYVATLLVRLARVNKDSYVWDFATGSAGLLVAALNEMLDDAKEKIKSPDELYLKSVEIKAQQLLGLEILSNIYMLAILNMILMGDGSSNILNKDSLKDFDGNYGFGLEKEKKKKFPADAFVLNPPYSADGNGMVFVEKALSMMEKGYAAIIIQGSAGSGRAVEYNKSILKHSTLLASIKMPIDLFIGKSIVQTYIYVFRVGEAHQNDDPVKFIDFSNDGYTRTNRKKASVNLHDTGDAKGRYAELVDLVRFGKSKLHIFTDKEYYEGKINPSNGADWNQTAPINTDVAVEDFVRAVDANLLWKMNDSLLNKKCNDDYLLGIDTMLKKKLDEIKWGNYKMKELFHIEKTLSFNSDRLVPGDTYDYVTRTSCNQGVLRQTGFVNCENINKAGSWSLGLLQMDFFYRSRDWYAGQFVRKIIPQIDISIKSVPFFSALLNKNKAILLNVLVRNVDKAFENIDVQLPETSNGQIDFKFIESFVEIVEIRQVISVKMHQNAKLNACLAASGLSGLRLSKGDETVIDKVKETNWADFSMCQLLNEVEIEKMKHVLDERLFSWK